MNRRLSLSLVFGIASTLISSEGAAQQISAPTPAHVSVRPLAVRFFFKPLPQRPFRGLALPDSIVMLARQQIGKGYRWGASSPRTGFDCSGLVKFVMMAIGRDVPRSSRDQSVIGMPVKRSIDALKPGDLLFFGNGQRVSHVGIFVGGGRYVHAMNRRFGVRETALQPSDRWIAARRVVSADGLIRQN